MSFLVAASPGLAVSSLDPVAQLVPFRLNATESNYPSWSLSIRTAVDRVKPNRWSLTTANQKSSTRGCCVCSWASFRPRWQIALMKMRLLCDGHVVVTHCRMPHSLHLWLTGEVFRMYPKFLIHFPGAFRGPSISQDYIAQGNQYGQPVWRMCMFIYTSMANGSLWNSG
jgi:hypothetical protein